MKKPKRRPSLRESRYQAILISKNFPDRMYKHESTKRANRIAGWRRRNPDWWLVELNDLRDLYGDLGNPMRSNRWMFITKLTEVIEWLHDNVHYGHMVVTADAFGFENLSDATHFKLRFV